MFLRRLSLALTVLIVLTLGPPSAVAAQPNDPPAPVRPAGRFVPNEVLVQFKPGVSEAEKGDARSRANAAQRERIRDSRQGDLELNSLPPGLAVADAARRLESHPAVAFAEPNWIYFHQATSNDPYYKDGRLWGMYGDGTSPGNQFGSQAGEAWAANHTGSKSVFIGVIDEGIQFAHPDLDANIWTNPKDSGDGADNDGNGYKDDIRGWDFHNNDNNCYDGGKRGSQDKHGTHVAGTIGAEANDIGVAGVNWNVTLICGKFLGPQGGYLSNAVKAVNYFTDLKTRHGLKIVATNNSWGGGGYSQALHDAIIRAAKQDILFVAAAGNDGTNNDSTDRYPSNYDTTRGTSTETAADYNSVIAVAALQSDGTLASWSNFGAAKVHLAAPGAGVWSTLPVNKYGSYSGTSMATPHVAGAAALYASTHSEAKAKDIRDAILTSTVATTSLLGKTLHGRLNVSGF